MRKLKNVVLCGFLLFAWRGCYDSWNGQSEFENASSDREEKIHAQKVAILKGRETERQLRAAEIAAERAAWLPIDAVSSKKAFGIYGAITTAEVHYERSLRNSHKSDWLSLRKDRESQKISEEEFRKRCAIMQELFKRDSIRSDYWSKSHPKIKYYKNRKIPATIETYSNWPWLWFELEEKYWPRLEE